jgi:hypothetical protein
MNEPTDREVTLAITAVLTPGWATRYTELLKKVYLAGYQAGLAAKDEPGTNEGSKAPP